MDIFAMAEKAAPVKAGKTKLRTIVPVKLGNKLTRLQEVRNEIAELAAEEAMLSGEIKPIGEQKFLELFKENKVRPENFVLQSDDGGKMLVIIQDKYLTLTTEKKEELEAQYKKDAAKLITTATTYSFNEKLLEKYRAQISAAIVGIKDIPDADKAKLIVPKTATSIKKGSIAEIFNYKKPEQLFKLIQPQVQLKNQSNDDED